MGAPPPIEPPNGHDAPDAGEPTSADPSRTGAIWVTALGAFLLLAAASVFVAVQWNAIPDPVKLGMLVALAGGLLIAGRKMRPSLPATASVVYHLGAFLLPVVAEALLVNFGQPWDVQLLATGAVAAIGFTILDREEDSVFLRGAAVFGVVVSIGGLGALLHVPSALVLAVVALVAYQLGVRKAATAWAIIAGLAPALALAQRFTAVHVDAIERLGLVGHQSRLASIVTGLAAAVVLARVAHHRRDLRFAAVALVVGLLGVVTGWIELTPTAGATWLAAAAAFLLIEVAAPLAQRDPFWAKPARWFATGTEWLTAPVVAAAVCAGALALVLGYRGPDLVPLMTGLLVAGGWFLADFRRRQTDNTPSGIALLVGGGWWPASFGLTGALFAGAVLSSAPPATTGALLLGLAAFFVLSGRPMGHGLAVVLAAAAPAMTVGRPGLSITYALVGAAILASAAVVRSRLSTSTAPVEAGLLSAATLAPLTTGMLMIVGSVDLFVVLLGGALTAWTVGVMLDRLSADGRTAWLGWIPRAGAVMTLAVAPGLAPRQLAGLAGTLTVLAIADGLRRREPAIAGIAAITLPAAITGIILAAGGSWATIGIACCVVATAAAALALTVPTRWQLPLLATVASHAAVGLVLVVSEPTALGVAMILFGTVGAVVAVVHHHPNLSFIGLLIATSGIWIELAAGGVHVLDAYVAPVAMVLLLAGWNARRDGAGSWVAYGPAIGLFGVTALLERIGGGGSVHALAAGGVGLVAVIVGGSRRLAAPLLLGSALLVGVAGYEVVAHTDAQLPMPAWLALGGLILMAAGIAMERRDQGPIETGRRLVDVVHERFS